MFRQPQHGYSLLHELAVIAAALTCCTWPLFGSHRLHPALLLTRTPSIVATGVLLGLAAWYALESHGALLGLAERCAAAAPPLWLLAVVVTTERERMQSTTSGDLTVSEPRGVTQSRRSVSTPIRWSRAAVGNMLFRSPLKSSDVCMTATKRRLSATQCHFHVELR